MAERAWDSRCQLSRGVARLASVSCCLFSPNARKSPTEPSLGGTRAVGLPADLGRGREGRWKREGTSESWHLIFRGAGHRQVPLASAGVVGAQGPCA